MKNLLSKIGIGIIDWYIIRKFLSTFVFSVLLFTMIAIFIDLSEKMDDFIKNKPTAYNLIFDYYVWFIPYFMGVFGPVFLFISTVFFNAKMAQNTELIAILNSGVSYKRFLKPYLISASILFFTFLIANMHIIPIADGHRLRFEDEWVKEKKVTRNDNIYYMLNDSTIIHMQSFNYIDSVGFSCSIEAFSQNKIYNRIFASRIIWNRKKQLWTLEGIQQRLFLSNDAPVRKLATLDTALIIRPAEFVQKANYVSSMTNPELNEFMRKEREKGAPIHRLQVELYRRVAVPASFFVLTLLAVAVSSRKNRGGTGAHLAIGFVITISYLFLIQVFNVMGNGGVMTPWLAVWIPPIAYMLVSLILLNKAPK